MSFDVLNSSLLMHLRNRVLPFADIEVIHRPASMLIKQKFEDTDIVQRIILLEPFGFTADKKNELNPHPEVRQAKIIIKGAIRANKSGFSTLKNVVLYSYLKNRGGKTEPDSTYIEIKPGLSKYREETKSSKDHFYVVKENGQGFYHNLINLTEEWIVMVLQKERRHQKVMDMDSVLIGLSEPERKIVVRWIDSVIKSGDAIFKKKAKIVNALLSLDADKTIPILVEALNIQETGRHEPCTVFATLLKLGREYPAQALQYLQVADVENLAPRYYLKELSRKLRHHKPIQTLSVA